MVSVASTEALDTPPIAAESKLSKKKEEEEEEDEETQTQKLDNKDKTKEEGNSEIRRRFGCVFVYYPNLVEII
jgi:hypothetical protein